MDLGLQVLSRGCWMAKMGWGWSEPRGWEEDPRALRAGAGVKQTSWHEPA